MSDKRFPPSPRRLARARERGNIARSATASASAVTLGAWLGILAIVVPVAGRTRDLLTFVLEPDAALQTLLLGVGKQRLLPLVGFGLVPLCAAAACALAMKGILVGFHVHFELLAPSVARLSPKGAVHRFFQWQALREWMLGLLTLGIGVGASMDRLWGVFRNATTSTLARADAWIIEGARGCLTAALCAAMVGLADALFARRRLQRSLMMTLEEAKREHQESQGNPQARAHRRSIHRRIAMGGSARGVQNASVVVVNPTQVAVALRYDEAEGAAPYLVAKGTDARASVMRGEASRCRVPVVANRPLARALLDFDVGEEIPEELYEVAAMVLREAFTAHRS